MENTLCVAKALNDLFKAEHEKDMDQMRMHKMMYFAQRESLMKYGEPLFKSEFQGWRYGPVLVEVRNEYTNAPLFSNVTGNLNERATDLVRSVYQRYCCLSSWDLSTLSHKEMSWKMSRVNLSAEDNGNVPLKLADMRVDAAKERLRRMSEEKI